MSYVALWRAVLVCIQVTIDCGEGLLLLCVCVRVLVLGEGLSVLLLAVRGCCVY